jgi:hypothetical protein
MSGDRPGAAIETGIVAGADLDAARALGLVLDARLDADELLDRLRAWAARAEGAYADNTWRAWRADIRVWCAWCRAGGRVAFPAAATTGATWPACRGFTARHGPRPAIPRNW